MVMLTGASQGPRDRDWKWSDARMRVGLLAEPFRTDFTRLFVQLEQLADAVQGLEQAVVDVCAGPYPPGIEHLLVFAGQDVVDLYHTTRLNVAALVPGRPSWVEEADPMEADAHASLFDRYARVLASAHGGDGWPDEFSAAVARVGEGLDGWYDGFRCLLDVIEQTVFQVLGGSWDSPCDADGMSVAGLHRLEN